MKNLLLTMLASIASLMAFSQVSITGSGTPLSVLGDGTAFVVDDQVTISSSENIDHVNVIIDQNFSQGDVLTYTGTLPTGVTANFNSSKGVLSFDGEASPSDYQSLLRTVAFQTSSYSVAKRTINFLLGPALAFSENGHYYQYVSGSFSWTDAKADAESKTLFGLQGYLATITSQAENDFIQQKLGADAWIGASDDFNQINAAKGSTVYKDQSSSEGHWYWVTGPASERYNFSNGDNSPVAASGKFMNWNGGEPNNYGGTENYAEIYSSGGGQWNDLSNANKLGYVLEFGGMDGDPVINLLYSRDISFESITASVNTTQSQTGYNFDGTAPTVTIDKNITVNSTANVTGAMVIISSNFQSGDILSYTATLPSGITANYNSSTGVLSFSGNTSYQNWQEIFRTVQFNTTSTVTSNRTITFSLGNLISGSNGHFYEYIPTETTWSDAKASATDRSYLGLKGYLATITSKDENDFITQKLSLATFNPCWFGASDSYSEINAATGVQTFADQTASEGHWYWVTGPAGEIGTEFSSGDNLPVSVNGSFINWDSGQPSNSDPYSYGSGENGANYGDIYSTGSGFTWNNDDGVASEMIFEDGVSYLVEYGGLATDAASTPSANKMIVPNSLVPITGLQFTATKTGEGISLKWSTQTEINSDHFVVEYSTDGVHFTAIHTLPAAGNSNTIRNYEWTHTNASNGNIFYRISEVDKDNRSVLSDIKQLDNGSIQAFVYPNPASSDFVLHYPANGKPIEVSVINQAGAVVLKTNITANETKISAQRWASGIYTVIINDQNHSTNLRVVKK